MDVTGNQGVQLGDGNVQINPFTGGRPQDPVVAGHVRQPAPDATAPTPVRSSGAVRPPEAP